MKKLVLMLIAILLMGTALVGCNSNPTNTQKSALICGGSVAYTAGVAVAAAFGEEEVAAEAESQGISHNDILQILPSCIEFGYDLISYTSPGTRSFIASASIASNPGINSSNQPQVTLSNKYSRKGVTSGKIYDITLGNCSTIAGSSPLQLQFNFSLSTPFQMSIGPKGASNDFRSTPTGNSDLDFVGRKIIDQYHLSNVANQINQVASVQIPPYKKVTISLSATVPYTYGIARFDQGGSTSYLPWAFADSLQSVQATLGVQSC